MRIDIPKRNGFVQLNDGDIGGSVWATKNIDPEVNNGKIRLSKVLGFRTNTADDSDLVQAAVGFTYTEAFVTNRYFAVAGDRMWRTSNDEGTSGWTDVSGSDSLGISSNSDIIAFHTTNYDVFVASDDLYGYDNSSFVSVGGLGTGSPHSMCVYDDRLYVTDNSRIECLESDETYHTSESYTIDPNTIAEKKVYITKIAPVSDGIWIATTYQDEAGGEMIFWDGVSENLATAQYKLSRGALAMCIKDDRPYIVDTIGRVRVFDNTTFVEIGRFPVKDRPLENYSSNDNDKWIHPNGMITVNDEIYMLVSNKYDDTNYNPEENFPAGIWAWNKNYGLYCKYTYSDVEVGPSPATPTDYGAFDLDQVGALFQSTGGQSLDEDERSEVMAGIRYYTDATTAAAAIAITDCPDTVAKAGYFVTSQIQADEFNEQWKNIVAVYDRLASTSSRIVVKYRTYEETPVYGTGTWAEDTRITTTSASSISEGDEVEILRGKGSGLCLTVESVSGTQVRFKENSLSSMSGTCRFRVQNWKEIADVSDTTSCYLKRVVSGGDGAWIQIKVYMEGSGKSPQLQRLIMRSTNKEEYD